MKPSFLFLLVTSAVAATSAVGCAGSLAAPFEQMKAQPITVYRLQNFEPPAAAAATPGLPPSPIPLPPQIQQWLGAGAGLLPPGLLPPGLLPGGAPAPNAQAQVPRFHNFRILQTQAITDSAQRQEVLDIFGRSGNFEARGSNCMYAEFGFAIGGGAGGSAPADVLVSLSCERTQMFNYNWPHGNKAGFGSDTAKRIVAVVQRTFGGG
jgi:hypothetical protein